MAVIGTCHIIKYSSVCGKKLASSIWHLTSMKLRYIGCRIGSWIFFSTCLDKIFHAIHNAMQFKWGWWAIWLYHGHKISCLLPFVNVYIICFLYRIIFVFNFGYVRPIYTGQSQAAKWDRSSSAKFGFCHCCWLNRLCALLTLIASKVSRHSYYKFAPMIYLIYCFIWNNFVLDIWT